MTAAVCQLDKLVPAISQLADRYGGPELSGPPEIVPCKAEAAAAFWHAIGSMQKQTIFFWQQDLGDCVSTDNGSSIPRVCSGELVLPRDRKYRCE